MSKYRATIYFHFKKGMKNKGMKILEDSLIQAAKQAGNLEAEINTSNEKPDWVFGTGLWENEKAAMNFKNKFEKIVEQLTPYLQEPPKRILWEVSNKSEYQQHRKAA